MWLGNNTSVANNKMLFVTKNQWLGNKKTVAR